MPTLESEREALLAALWACVDDVAQHGPADPRQAGKVLVERLFALIDGYRLSPPRAVARFRSVFPTCAQSGLESIANRRRRLEVILHSFCVHLDGMTDDNPAVRVASPRLRGVDLARDTLHEFLYLSPAAPPNRARDGGTQEEWAERWAAQEAPDPAPVRPSPPAPRGPYYDALGILRNG